MYNITYAVQICSSASHGRLVGILQGKDWPGSSVASTKSEAASFVVWCNTLYNTGCISPGSQYATAASVFDDVSVNCENLASPIRTELLSVLSHFEPLAWRDSTAFRLQGWGFNAKERRQN